MADQSRRHCAGARAFQFRRVSRRTRPQGRLPDRKPESRQRRRRCAPISSKDLQPAFAALDFTTRLIESPTGKGPYLLADYREDASLPTVLTYGHGDVVDGMEGEWRDNLDPWTTTVKGERVYGRGTADNKGQHSINLAALARGARDPRRQARLQRQIHHRDRRGDRLARSAAGVRGASRGTEGGSVSGLRRAAAFGRPADHLPRLPRRQPHPSRRQSARGRQSFRQLGRRARQSGDDPVQAPSPAWSTARGG